jgi:transcriptional regulator with XRE-family HTH domain
VDKVYLALDTSGSNVSQIQRNDGKRGSMKTIFSERLKAARVLRNVTQMELNKASGIDTSQIANFELGNRKPSFDNLKKLCDALNISADYLLGISEFPYVTQDTVVTELMSGLSNRDFDLIIQLLRYFNKEKQ